MENTETIPTKSSATIPPLWKHQLEALHVMGNRHALFFDPGCGKSRTALEKLNITPVGSAVIFAPLNVCRNWVNEIKYYCTRDWKPFVVAGQSRRKKMLIISEWLRTPNSILIMNIECLRSKDYTNYFSRDKSKCQFIIVDESHNFKGWKSQQTLGLLNLIGMAKPRHLYLLTGTPAPQGEIDLWSTFYMLGCTDKPFFLWRKKYFDDKNARRAGTKGYYPDFVVRRESQVEFQRMLARVSSVAKKDEVLDLPPLLHLDVFCELSEKQRKHYKTMLDWLFAADENGEELNASNILVRTLRLQQIVAGFLGDVAIPDNPRLKALDYAIEQTNGEQFIIWTIFSATYKQLGDRLIAMGIPFGFLTGEQSAEDRHQTIEQFQRGELRALIANPKAGGVGVNLTAASYSIHYTKNFNLVDDLQCEARNYRAGSERHKKITRIDIQAEDTIDEDITMALRAKKNIQDFILGLKQKRQGK